MARIIYAVAGEGFGHSSRSHTIAQMLINASHQIMFVGSRNSLKYLTENYGDNVKEVFGLGFAFRNGKVNTIATVKWNLKRLPQLFRINKTLFTKHVKKFKPQLVVTDFEPFCAIWAWRNHIPFISVDHEHMLTHCKLQNAGHPGPRFKAKLVTRCYYSGAFAYVVVNFFNAPLKTANTILAPPVVRDAAVSTKTKQDNHIVAYSTAGTAKEQFIQILNNFPNQKFIVYGFNQDAQMNNCILKTRSTKGFLNDLASSRGVIASAGFSLISECMFFKKKMCLVPVPGQYEQIINAHYVQKLGLGLSVPNLNQHAVAKFIDELQSPVPTNGNILRPDNKKFFKILSKVFRRLPKPIKLELP